MELEENGAAEAVRWERFLPQTALRVLLVEPDDSTRHVISALLRKCSYKVTSTSDGLEAWDTLKRKPQSIDLILTEVELPTISGFTLLTLVMDHDACKNISVIMMSSEDSISTVLKCMLKGAADFLIKPIRKNELTNLWQHVWRRQISTGEECLKVKATSEKTAASSPSNEYILPEQEEVECRETKIASKDFSQMECEDLVDHNKADDDDDECVKIDRESELRQDTLSNEIRDSAILCVLDDDTNVRRVTYGDSERPKFRRKDSNGAFELCGTDTLFVESLSPAAIDLIGAFGAAKRKCEISNLTVGKSSSTCGPQSELSLLGSGPRSSQADEGHLLNHSSASAFSRYSSGKRLKLSSLSTSNLHSKAQRIMNTANESKPVNKSYFQTAFINNGDKCADVISEQSERVGNTCAASLQHFQTQGSSVNLIRDYCLSPSPLIAQEYHTIPWSIQQTSKPNQSLVQISNSGSSKLRKRDCADRVNAEGSNDMNYGENKLEEEDYTGAVAFRVGSLIRDTLNSSSVGADNEESIHNTRDAKLDKDAGIGCATSTGSRKEIPVCGGPNRVDTLHSSEREAALIKFRKKRMQRCFEKKVRYESRKQLAVLRPRVNGQFVRQFPTDSASSAS